MANKLFVSKKGITIIELVIIIVIAGILAVFSIMKFHSFIRAASVVVVKNNLAILRQGIWNFYLEEINSAQARFPTVEEVSEDTGGCSITEDLILPGNPFDKDGDPNNVVSASDEPMGTVIGSSGGWAYRSQESFPGAGDAGQIWANTATEGVDENKF